MTSNISTYTLVKQNEYFCIHISNIPHKIITEYGLKDKVGEYESIHVEVGKGVYRLPQAGILAQKLLSHHLRQH